MYKTLVYTFLLHLLSCCLSATPTLLPPNFESLNILELGEYYLTANLSLTADEVQHLPDSAFAALSVTDGSFFAGDQAIWVKISVQHDEMQARDLLLEVREVRINEIQFFSFRDGQLVDSSGVTGDYHPFASRALYHPYFLYPINMEQGANYDIFICYKKLGETITLNTLFWEKNAFLEVDRNESFVFNLFLGALLCITLIATVIAMVTGRKLLKSFALYCVACLLMVLLMTGYGFMYLWPNYPYWNGLGYFFVILYYLGMIQMTQLYMETKRFTPRFHRFFSISQWLLTLVFVPLVLSHWIIPDSAKAIVGRTGLIFLFLITGAIVLSCVYIIHRKRTWGSAFFLLGFSFTIVALILFEVEQIGSMDTFWGTESTLLCILFDFLILLTVFSNQIRQTFLRNSQLKQALTETQLSAAHALLEGQQKERQRLSRELHDGISIQMALLKMNLSSHFTENTAAEKEIISSVGSIAQDIRAFTHAIAPLNLDRQTLTEAVDDLILKVQNQANLQVKYRIDDLDEGALATQEKHAIFQSLQELFNNTLKYAEASRVALSLVNKDRFELIFEDNGKGFDPAEIKGGMGLKNIEARAKLLNGSFAVHSSGAGSRFELIF
ncbi:MAG: hypothetical protein HRU41_20115 [Saprospiraceae bacterium]|nr:hypothetical protein [Saprospiraceae bacterium]